MADTYTNIMTLSLTFLHFTFVLFEPYDHILPYKVTLLKDLNGSLMF